jgi:argininosuccinate lyase
MTQEKANLMWGGRFACGQDALMEEINASIDFDKRLAEHDIFASKVHAKMLSDQGIISEEDYKSIVGGLDQISLQIKKNEFVFDRALEDIHMNVEARLKEIIGESAGRLHTARSRNDQVATDTRLWTKKSAKEIQKLIKMVMRSILNQANKHQQTSQKSYARGNGMHPQSLIWFRHPK